MQNNMAKRSTLNNLPKFIRLACLIIEKHEKSFYRWCGVSGIMFHMRKHDFNFKKERLHAENHNSI